MKRKSAFFNTTHTETGRPCCVVEKQQSAGCESDTGHRWLLLCGKGACINIGANQCGNLAKALEAAGKHKDEAFIKENLQTFQVEYEKLLQDVSAKSNFDCDIFRDVYLNTPGKYRLSVEYRGTNTTGVEATLFLKVITCNGEQLFE